MFGICKGIIRNQGFLGSANGLRPSTVSLEDALDGPLRQRPGPAGDDFSAAEAPGRRTDAVPAPDLGAP